MSFIARYRVDGYVADNQSTLDYGFLTLGGTNVAGILQMDGPEFGDMRSGWQTYIAVEDRDAMAAKAKSGRGIGCRFAL